MARSVGITREQVVSVAAELADAHGLAALTLAQIAARLQVKLPSLYNHVAGLPGLRRELAILSVRQIGERLARAAIGKSGDDAILAIAQAYRGFVLERPGLYAAGVPAPDPADAEHLALARDVIEVILAVLAPYQLDESGAIHAVRGLRAIAHGFATIEQAGGFGLALDRDQSFLRLVRGYTRGLHRDSDS